MASHKKDDNLCIESIEVNAYFSISVNHYFFLWGLQEQLTAIANFKLSSIFSMCFS